MRRGALGVYAQRRVGAKYCLFRRRRLDSLKPRIKRSRKTCGRESRTRRACVVLGGGDEGSNPSTLGGAENRRPSYESRRGLGVSIPALNEPTRAREVDALRTFFKVLEVVTTSEAARVFLGAATVGALRRGPLRSCGSIARPGPLSLLM
jgi:hypothetical protein